MYLPNSTMAQFEDVPCKLMLRFKKKIHPFVSSTKVNFKCSIPIVEKYGLDLPVTLVSKLNFLTIKLHITYPTLGR